MATRPGTSTKIRSASMVFVRRSRRATTRSNCIAICGRSWTHFCSAVFGSRATRASVTTVAVAVRGPGSNSDSSPNWSDGPMIATRFSRPSDDRRPSFTLPASTMNRLSPGSPSWNRMVPRGASTISNSLASASTDSGSTPWNNPALRMISSTSAPSRCHHQSARAASHSGRESRATTASGSSGLRRRRRQPSRWRNRDSAESVPSRTKVSSSSGFASSRNCSISRSTAT